MKECQYVFISVPETFAKYPWIHSVLNLQKYTKYNKKYTGKIY